MSDKVYLGDGVYVERKPYDVVLTTEDGFTEATNTIYIDPAVWLALCEFMERDKC